MKTKYIPHGGMGSVGLEFERLELHRTCLIQQIALSHLFSWNYATKLTPIRDELVRNYRERYSLRSKLEMLVAGLVACLALCACGPDDKGDSTPEIAGPCPPGLPVTVRAAHRLEDGSIVLLIERND